MMDLFLVWFTVSCMLVTIVLSSVTVILSRMTQKMNKSVDGDYKFNTVERFLEQLLLR